MSTNGINTTDDADMSECDGEKVVTMMDVLQEQEEFEEDANAVLGASDDKDCTYSKGYIKRQAIYACLTCCVEAKSDPTKRAGVCLACSLSCHENHELVELYTKRNFRCDCGNPKFNSHPCQFTPNKTEFNEENDYNQNFSGLYCICHRPYPDPESTLDEDEMIQCIVCEDWLHASHLEATIPTEQYAEMICKGCMENNKFIHDYSEFAVNEDVDIEAVESEDAIIVNGNSKCNGSEKETLPINDIDSSLTNKDNETKEEMEVDKPIKDETETATKPEDDSLEKDKVNIENEESDKTNDCYEKENNSANESEQKVVNTDNFEKSDVTNITESKDSETVSDDSKDAEAETVASESKDTDITGAESKNIETVTAKDTETADAESNNTGTANAEFKDTETAGTESKDSESAGKELKDSESAGTESKDSETGTESKDSDTAGTESKDTERADAESKDIEGFTEVIEPKTDNENESLTSTGGGQITETTDSFKMTSDSVPETADAESNDIEGATEVIEPKVDNEKESRSSTEGGKSTETTDSSKVTSDLVPNTDNVTSLEQNFNETVKETENRPITEDNVGLSEEKERENLEKQDSNSIGVDTDNNKESSENNVEMTHIKIDDTDNANKMETGENGADDDLMAKSHSRDESNKEEKIISDITNNDGTDNDKDSNKVECASNGSEVPQRTSDQSLEKDQVPEVMEVLSNPQENKRKLSTDKSEDEDLVTKKAKLEESKQCIRPKGIKKRFRGATFWSSNIRQKFCTCNECITMYKDLSVLFLIDPEDTVTAYEALGKENIDGTASQYEKGLQALSSLGRIQQINALTEYNKMRDKLLDFLKSFKERKEVVKEEDIKAFFAGMKPKREPDGVYFCR